MIRGTILDRRTCDDRREGEASAYTGPDRRKPGDRRDEKITICVFCGDICGDKKSWFKTPESKEIAADYQIYVCDSCASKLSQPIYPDNRLDH